MSRKRYISTEISTDTELSDLSEHGGLLPLLLFTWAIPHMDDWGRITGDPKQFKLLVCPGLNISTKDVEDALDLLASFDLWVRYEVNGKQCISMHLESWFKHQSYINKAKRSDDTGSNFPSPDDPRRTPKNTEEHQESPQITEIQQGMAQIAASFSLSSSPSFSFTPSNTSTTTTSVNPFKIFESEGFGVLSSVLGDKIGDMIDTYGERWVCEAMKEAAYYGKRNLPYVKSILERYRTSGVDEPWLLEKVKQFPSSYKQPSKSERVQNKLDQLLKEAEAKDRDPSGYYQTN